MDKKTFKDMGYKTFGMFGALGSVMSSLGRAAIAKAKELGITGNLKGDIYQNGGTLIVNTEGKVLLSWKQDSPADHVPLADVLKALGIDGPPPPELTAGGATGGPSTAPEVVCDENVCQVK